MMTFSLWNTDPLLKTLLNLNYQIFFPQVFQLHQESTARIRFAGEGVALECCPRGHILGLINPFILRADWAPPEAPRRNVTWMQEAWIGSALPFLGKAGAYFVFQTLNDYRALKALFNHITRPALEWRTSLAIPLSQNHLDPVLYARLNLLWAHFQRCSLPLRCFWFAVVHGRFLAQIAGVEMTAELNWGPVFSVLPRGAFTLHRGQESVLPDKQTVKCLDGDRSSVNSEISPLCRCASLADVQGLRWMFHFKMLI